MRPTPQVHDRYIVPIPCDRCGRTATYTYRYRYPGTGWMERHTCNPHRKAIERKLTEPQGDDRQVVNLMRVSRTAF
jgi:hypothetical protein